MQLFIQCLSMTLESAFYRIYKIYATGFKEGYIFHWYNLTCLNNCTPICPFLDRKANQESPDLSPHLPSTEEGSSYTACVYDYYFPRIAVATSPPHC